MRHKIDFFKKEVEKCLNPKALQKSKKNQST